MLTANSKAAAPPAVMSQPAAAPASTLLADASTQAAASPLALGQATAAAAAAPSPSMSHASGSPHGNSQGAAESSGTGQPQTTDTPSLLPGSQVKQLQCSNGQVQSPNGQVMSSNGQFQSLDGHTECSASPRKPGLPAMDPISSLGMPHRSASDDVGLNSALNVDVTQTQSTSAKGSLQQSSETGRQPLETAGHTQSGRSPSSSRPSGTMGRSHPLIGSSSPVMGSSRRLVGRSNPEVGSASAVVGTPMLCKPTGITLQPTRSPSQLKGKLDCLPIDSANQLPSLPVSSIQPADHNDYSLNMFGPSEHAFNTAQPKDNAVTTQHEKQLVNDDACETAQAQQAEQAQQPAQAPCVSCSHSMPIRSHGQSDATDCSSNSKQQVNRGTSAPVIDEQITSEAASLEIPASTQGTLAVAAASSEEEAQGATAVGKQSVTRQQSAGLATLAAAITSKQLPAPSRPPSTPGKPPEGRKAEDVAPAPCLLTGLGKVDAAPLQDTGKDALTHRSAEPSGDTVPTSIARVFRHHPHEHATCTHSTIPEEGRQAVAAAQDSIVEAADTDKLTHMTDTPAESAGEVALASENSPSSEEGAIQKEISHTAVELFCMVSDRDSQDVANSQDVACTPTQGNPSQGFPPQIKNLQLQACTHQHACHNQQLAPAVSQHQTPLTALPQQLIAEHAMSSVAALSLAGLHVHKQDAQGLPEAAGPTVDRLDPAEHHENFTNASVSDGTAAKQSDANEKENRQAIESAMASGE